MRPPGHDVDLVPPWSRPLWALGLALPLLLLAGWLCFRGPAPAATGAVRLGSPGLRASIEAERR